MPEIKKYWIVTCIACLLIGGVIGYVVMPPRVEVVTEGPAEQLPYLNYLEFAPNLEMPPSDYKGTLRVYCWAGYEQPVFWDVGDYAFRTVYPNVGVKWLFYEDEAAAMAKMMVDPTYADLVYLYSGSPLKWFEAGLIEPLDLNMLPLFDEFYPQIMGIEDHWIEGEYYFAPLEIGYTTVIYRYDILSDLGIPEEDWNDYNLIFNSYGGKMHGQVWLYDSAREAVPLAALAAGIPIEDLWNMTDEQLELVKAKLLEGKPNVAHYWVGWEEGYGAILTGEAAAVSGWGDTYMFSKMGSDMEMGTEDDVPVRFMWAKQGVMTWFGGWSIVEGLKERDPELYKVAHAFITAQHDREGQANKIDYWAYGPVNRYATEICERQEVVEEFHLDDPEFFLGGNMYSYTPNEDKWYDLWLEVKA